MASYELAEDLVMHCFELNQDGVLRASGRPHSALFCTQPTWRRTRFEGGKLRSEVTDNTRDIISGYHRKLTVSLITLTTSAANKSSDLHYSTSDTKVVSMDVKLHPTPLNPSPSTRITTREVMEIALLTTTRHSVGKPVQGKTLSSHCVVPA
ncbi:hypothetical protein DPMN_125513 [Dreissena polymorpha]|uniref:Uncharacterized protein n=1 Tax=Dreissena polymorpha TaxID=45954 RepID=A0A9D4JUS6_DREPO|nr:hypothetical protein DPMN_125513 [Dreissena polymorpha]